jgi:hypothetical protein
MDSAPSSVLFRVLKVKRGTELNSSDIVEASLGWLVGLKNRTAEP